METSLKARFKKLPLSRKLVLIGSFAMVLSVFLPWYSDIDQFNSGETFLGITGPLYLAGFFVFIAAAMSFGITLLNMLERPEPRLPMKTSHFHVAVSGFSIFMLLLTSSVYFHPKFGINLTDKNAGIGMMMALAGSLMVAGGAVLKIKAGKNLSTFEENVDKHVAPLVKNLHRDHMHDVTKQREAYRENLKDITAIHD